MSITYRTETAKIPAHGLWTMVITGIHPLDEIESASEGAVHYYCGEGNSFAPTNHLEWQRWDTMISGLLKTGAWVTLECDAAIASEILEEAWCEYNNFIPLISVKLPYIKLLNYNTTVKIDDSPQHRSNIGKWYHSLHSLTDPKTYVRSV